MSLKVKGTAYYFSQYGGEQPIPAEFVAAMRRTEKVQPVPNEVGPEALGDTVVESRVVTDQTGERMLHTIGKIAGNITLRGVNTDNDGQPVQVTRVLHPTGTQPDEPTATTKVGVTDLGNGWSIQESSVEGTYVNGVFTPGIFGGDLYRIETPETIPLKFRAIVPVITHEDTVEGIATLPTLGIGDLTLSEEQTDEFKKRVVHTYRDVTVLPKSLVSYDTSDPKQVVTITETLQLATATVASPTATRTVAVENLGDGTVLQTTRDVPSVFAQMEYSAERPDVTPEDFRALLVLAAVSTSSSGNAGTPSLVTGDIQARDEQMSLFTHRTTVAHRALPTAGATLTNQEVYEGLPVTVTRTLATGNQNISPDYLTLDSSRMQLLGDGRSLMERKTVTGYNARIGQTVDEQLGLPRTYTLQKVSTATAASYAGTAEVVIEPFDEVRAYVKDIGVVSAEADALAAYKVSYGATIDVIDFPPTLIAFNVEWETSIGKGDNMEQGQSTLSGSGTLQLELPESAEASASVVPNVTPTIQSTYARNVVATDEIFFVVNGTTTAAILARAGALPWPVFQPVSHTLICKGQTVTVRANANARFAISLSPNGNSTATSAGSGGDQRTDHVTRAVTIPACIHGPISVGGTATPPSGGGLPGTIPVGGYTNFPPGTGIISLTSNTSMQVKVTATAVADVLAPAAYAKRTVTLTANGSISPSAFAATPGISTIPTSGVYAYRVSVEPYRPGWSMVRVRTVDFALLRAHTGGTLTVTADGVVATGGAVLGVSGGADTPTPILALPAIDSTDLTLAPVPIVTSPDQVPGANPGDGTTPTTGGGSGTTTLGPIITTQPSDVYTALSTFVTLSVVALGSDLVYQWFSGTTTIVGATNSSYTFKTPNVLGSGTYHVVVTNTYGTVTSTDAMVHFDGSTPTNPVIMQQPQSAIWFYNSVNGVQVGGFHNGDSAYGSASTTFNVVATSTGTLGYQWRYGKQVGTGPITWHDIYQANSASLVVTEQNLPQVIASPGSTFFDVIVTDTSTGDNVTSSSAALTFRVPLPGVTFLRPVVGTVVGNSSFNGKTSRVVLALNRTYDSDIEFLLTTNGHGQFSTDSAGGTTTNSLVIAEGSLGATTNQYGVVRADAQLFYIADPADFVAPLYGTLTFTATAQVDSGTGSTTVALKVVTTATLVNQDKPFN